MPYIFDSYFQCEQAFVFQEMTSFVTVTELSMPFWGSAERPCGCVFGRRSNFL